MNLSIQYSETTIHFTVEYRKRKTVEIRIVPPGDILVICPKGLPQYKIKDVVSKKGQWILKKLEELRNIQYQTVEKRFDDGDKLLFLGEEHTLLIEVDETLKRPKVEHINRKIIVITPRKDKELIKKALELWYRERASEKIRERVECYKLKIGKEPRNVKVKEQKKRWGSCTSKGDIYFNWKIIMAPVEVIDYVVVHELCHLIHMNHSKEYWKVVEDVMPDYKERRKWLKKNGMRIDL